MTFILYEIPSTSTQTISPPCWTVKYILNYKKLPFQTRWTEYPDIRPLYEKNSISPTAWNSDGSPRYTLPVLYDPRNARYISESFEIVKYLETTYGYYTDECDGSKFQVPSVFPFQTASLHAAFSDAFRGTVMPSIAILMVAIWRNLNPESKGFYDNARMKTLGKSLAAVAPTPEIEASLWQKYKGSYTKVDGWFGAAQGDDGGVPIFLMQGTASWADFLIAGHLATLKVAWGEDSEQWGDLRGWHSGRWGKLMDAIQEYEKEGI